MPDPITALVVSYNRKDLLVNCIDALFSQSSPPDRILIIDNRSTDGTRETLIRLGLLNKDNIECIRLSSNTGGAGGFCEGIKTICQKENQWLWLLDDDAVPDRFALENILQNQPDRLTVYGSAAVGNNKKLDEKELLCWPVQPRQEKNSIELYEELATLTPVKNIPFLGFFIHSTLIRKVGLPDSSFFISGDDAEYCARIQCIGSDIILVKPSVIRHPLPQRTSIKILGKTIHSIRLSPWKRYYDVRNRLLIAGRYYGMRLWTETVPGTVVRWLTVMLTQQDRFNQCKAFAYGIRDGLRGRSGCLWQPGQTEYKK